MARAGFCRLFGLWLIYPPAVPGVADGWDGRGQVLTQQFHETFAAGRREDFDWLVEPDGDWELASRLVLFGWSENGDGLFWDPDDPSEEELAVWASYRFDSLHRLGPSLPSALPRLRDNAFARDAPADIYSLVPARLA